MSQEFIKEFGSGKILGIIETDSNGDQKAIDFDTRKILGFYRKKNDHTTDFYGRIIARGNCVASLIFNKR